MSSNSNGFIKIPRSLLDDPLWMKLSLKYQNIFLIICKLACFRKHKFDDHGHIIDLEPGQLCISEDDLRKICHASISANDIHRGIVKLKLCGFLNHKVNHRKSVITITYPGFYDDDKNESEPRNEPNLNQTRTTKEECKECKEDILPSHSLASLPSGTDNLSFSQYNITPIIRRYCLIRMPAFCGVSS